MKENLAKPKVFQPETKSAEQGIGDRLPEYLALELYDHWGNLINTIAAFLEIKKDDSEKVSQEMKKAVSERVAGIERVISQLGAFLGEEALTEKLQQSLLIVEQMVFDKKILQNSNEKKVYQEKLSQLLKLYTEIGKY